MKYSQLHNTMVIGCMVNANRAAYIPVLAWFALQWTGSNGAVGASLACYSLVSFLLGPYIGKYIDGIDSKAALILGEVVSCLGFLILLYISWRFQSGNLLPLLIAASLISVGSLMSVPSFFSLLKLHSNSRRVAKSSLNSSALFSVVNTFSVIASSTTLSLYSPFLAFLLNFSLSFLTIIFSACTVSGFSTERIRRSDGGSAQKSVRSYLSKNSQVSSVLVYLVAAFAGGQVFNSMTAPFVENLLGGSPADYSLVYSSWAIGTIVSMLALTFANSSGAFISTKSSALALTGLGFLLLTSPHVTSLYVAVLWHFLMGLSFGAIRSICDALFVEKTDSEFLGRVRNVAMSASGFTGLIVFLAPSFLSVSIQNVYHWCFVFILACLAAVYWLASNRIFNNQLSK